jgi:hypothetical protein
MGTHGWEGAEQAHDALDNAIQAYKEGAGKGE